MATLRHKLPFSNKPHKICTLQAQKSSSQFPSPQSFAAYAQLIFQGLVISETIQQRKERASGSISEHGFQKFFGLPFLVSKQLFWVFNDQKQSTLNGASFKSGILLLLFGSESEKLELVFKLLRISQSSSSVLHESECQALLYHIAISEGHHIFGFYKKKYQSLQKSLDEAIKSLFSWARKRGAPQKCIELEDFLYFCRMIESDIPQMVLSFIYERSKIVKKVQEFEASLLLHNGRRTSEPLKVEDFRKPNAQLFGLGGIGHIRFMKEFEPIKRLYSYNSSQPTREYHPPISKSKSMEAVASESKSPLCDKSFYYSLTQRMSQEEKEDIFKSQALLPGQNDQGLKWHGGKIFRFVEENKIQAFWYELRDSTLYSKQKRSHIVFKNDSASTPRKILPLGKGFMVKENGLVLRLEAVEFYSFDLIFPSGCKKELLVREEEDYWKWVKGLKAAVQSFDFYSEFQINETVEVNENETSHSGFSLETGVSVFITQLYKIKCRASIEEQRQYQRELDQRIQLIKICQHPLFPKLIRVEETPDLYFIIEEGIEGESLESLIACGATSQPIVKSTLQQLTQILTFAKKMKVLLRFKLSTLIVNEASNSTVFSLKIVSLKTARFIYNEEEDSQEDVLQAGLIMRKVALHWFMVSHLQESLEGCKAKLSWDSFGIGLSSLIKSEQELIIRNASGRERKKNKARRNCPNGAVPLRNYIHFKQIMQEQAPNVVYWEMQGSDRLCGVHCLNALVQAPIFTEIYLADIGRQLDKKEKEIFISETGMTESDYYKHVKFGSNNVSLDGNYGIQVLQEALKRHGGFVVDNINKKDIKDSIKDWCDETAFLCNSVAHWFVIRKINGVWYNLNSANQGIGPEIISPFYMDAFITSVQEQGYTIFVVRGDSFKDANPKLNPSKRPNQLYIPQLQVEEYNKKNPVKTPNIYGTDERDLKRAMEASLKDIGGADNQEKFHGKDNFNYAGMVQGSSGSSAPKEDNSNHLTEEQQIAMAIQMSMEAEKKGDVPDGVKEAAQEAGIPEEQIDQELSKALLMSMKEAEKEKSDQQ